MICYWSERCMLRPSLRFVSGQNTVCYDQVYDLLLVRTLCYDQVYDLLLFRTPYVTISNSYILIDCCVHIVFDQVYDLLLVRTLYVTTKFTIWYWSEHYVTTKFMICYWSEHCMLRPSWWFNLLLVSTLYVTTKFMICCWSERCMLRPSLWFVTGQNAVCYDQVNDYTPSLRRGRGVYYFTSFRPSKIFFVTFFSLTVDGRNLIFGQKHHIGIPYCG
jgi:hypothetical protein